MTIITGFGRTPKRSTIRDAVLICWTVGLRRRLDLDEDLDDGLDDVVDDGEEPFFYGKHFETIKRSSNSGTEGVDISRP